MKSAHFSLPVFGTSMGKSIMEFFHVHQVCFIQQVSCKTNKICILKRMSGFLHVLLHPACIKKMSSQSEPSHCQETLRWGISFKISITDTPTLVDPASWEKSPLDGASATFAWLGTLSYQSPMTLSSSHMKTDWMILIIHSFDDLPVINAAKAALLSQNTTTSFPASTCENNFNPMKTASVSNSAMIVSRLSMLIKEISSPVSHWPK